MLVKKKCPECEKTNIINVEYLGSTEDLNKFGFSDEVEITTQDRSKCKHCGANLD